MSPLYRALRSVAWASSHTGTSHTLNWSCNCPQRKTGALRVRLLSMAFPATSDLGALGVETGLWGPPMIAMHLPHPGFPWEAGWSLGPGTLGPFHTRIPPGSLVMCIRVTRLPQFGWDFPSFKTESPMSQEHPQPGTSQDCWLLELSCQDWISA